MKKSIMMKIIRFLTVIEAKVTVNDILVFLRIIQILFLLSIGTAMADEGEKLLLSVRRLDSELKSLIEDDSKVHPLHEELSIEKFV